MLLLIGLVGLMATIYRCRLPGVAFFSFITVFNRKSKLTATGSQVYLVFFGVLVLGLLLSFAGGGGSKAAAPALAGSAQSGAAPGRSMQEIDAADLKVIMDNIVLARRASFSVLLIAPEMARIREQIDHCEDEFRAAADAEKASGPDARLGNIVKNCMSAAAKMCQTWRDSDAGYSETPACNALHEAQPFMWG